MTCILLFAAVLSTALWLPLPALAEEVTLTDVAGREVVVDVPVRAAILGEGALLHGVAPLLPDDPFAPLAGWPDDLKAADPATWAAYEAAFPEAASLPSVGEMTKGEFDAEQALALSADVVIMPLEAKAAADESGLEAELAAIGTPLVYVDFREAQMANTGPSMRLLGQLFGAEDRAAAFLGFRAGQIARVTSVIAAVNPDRPVVFLDRAASASEACCPTFGAGNLGALLEMAGGANLAADLVPAALGKLDPAQVGAADPDHVVAVGADWSATGPGGMGVGLGPGADLAAAEAKLGQIATSPAYRGTNAAEAGNFHAFWPSFSESPYDFVAIQQLARWLHPDLFAALDPEATLAELHDRFLPTPYRLGYFVSLEADGTDG